MSSTPRQAALLPRERILAAAGRRPDPALAVAEAYGIGVEVQTFAWPDLLDAATPRRVSAMARRLQRVSGRVGVHGPFIDTLHFSLDAEIQRVSRARYMRAIEIAGDLGAEYVLFHSQYNPLIKLRTYAELYHERSLAFWPEVIDMAEAARVCVYIENMFDAAPDPMRRLLHALDSPRFRACLDPAHVMLHSEADCQAWILALGPYLGLVHLSDCGGVYDDHLAVGAGVIEWPHLFSLLEGLTPLYTLETGRHTRKSLAYLNLPPEGTGRDSLLRSE